MPSDARRRRTTGVAALLLLALLPASALAKRQYTFDPKNGKAVLAAQEALQAEQYAEAENILRKLRMDRLNPYEAAVVYQLRGYGAASQEKYADAVDYFELCLKQEALPDTAQQQIRFTVAQLYLILERWQNAIDNFELWFEQVEAPTSHAYYMLAVAYYQSGSPEKALAPAKAAVEKSEEPKERWLQLLLSLYVTEKQYTEALPLLEQLVSRFPKKVYWVQLAAIYAALEQDEKSLAVQQLAYAQGMLDTDRELRRLAQMYLYNYMPYRAAKVMEKGLAEGTVEEDSDAWRLLGDSWLTAKEYEKALQPLTRAAALSKDGGLYLRLGQVYVQREAWDDAVTVLNKALQKGGLQDPGNAHLLIGIARYNQKQYDAARNAFARAQDDDKSREAAGRWLDYLAKEEQRRG